MRVQYRLPDGEWIVCVTSAIGVKDLLRRLATGADSITVTPDTFFTTPTIGDHYQVFVPTSVRTWRCYRADNYGWFVKEDAVPQEELSKYPPNCWMFPMTSDTPMRLVHQPVAPPQSCPTFTAFATLSHDDVISSIIRVGEHYYDGPAYRVSLGESLKFTQVGDSDLTADELFLLRDGKSFIRCRPDRLLVVRIGVNV